MEKYTKIFDSYLEKHYPLTEEIDFKAESDFERATFIMNMFRANDPIQAVCLAEKDQNIAVSNIADGNDYLAEGDFTNALEDFNKAILHAPADTKPYIKGFGKRSECLSRMGFHKEALLCVEHALKCIGIEEGYKKELERQKKMCAELASLSSSSPVSSCPNESLPLIRNEYLTSASNKVEMSANTSVGRLLKATADIRTGEVLMIEKPYARSVDIDLRYSNCWNCTKYCIDPHPCTKCSDAMFCSQNCLEEAKKYHDFECPMMHLLINDLGVPKLYLLALHMFLIATEHGTKLNELKQKVDNIDVELKTRMTYDSNDFIRIYNLKCHPTRRSANYYFYITFFAGYIISALSKCTNLFEDASSDLQVFACSLLLRFFLIMESNAQTITAMDLEDEEFFDVGDAMYATFSLINHSCDPNVERHDLNESLVVRAIKPIKAGEELTISYKESFALANFSSRQNSLAQYNFTCICEACEHRWPTYPFQLSTQPELKKPMDDTTKSRYSDLCDKFIATFQFNWKEDDIQLVNKVEFTPEIMNWLCEFIDLTAEYVDSPHQRYSEAHEALKRGFDYFPGFQRSFGTTEDTDAAAPQNE